MKKNGEEDEYKKKSEICLGFSIVLHAVCWLWAAAAVIQFDDRISACKFLVFQRISFMHALLLLLYVQRILAMLSSMGSHTRPYAHFWRRRSIVHWREWRRYCVILSITSIAVQRIRLSVSFPFITTMFLECCRCLYFECTWSSKRTFPRVNTFRLSSAHCIYDKDILEWTAITS